MTQSLIKELLKIFPFNDLSFGQLFWHEFSQGTFYQLLKCVKIPTSKKSINFCWHNDHILLLNVCGEYKYVFRQFLCLVSIILVLPFGAYLNIILDVLICSICAASGTINVDMSFKVLVFLQYLMIQFLETCIWYLILLSLISSFSLHILSFGHTTFNVVVLWFFASMFRRLVSFWKLSFCFF